jgi:hypothetical protein
MPEIALIKNDKQTNLDLYVALMSWVFHKTGFLDVKDNVLIDDSLSFACKNAFSMLLAFLSQINYEIKARVVPYVY